MANIPILTGGGNYRKWKWEIRAFLIFNALNICLDNPKPSSITTQSSKQDRTDFEKWWSANKLVISVIETGMTDTVRGAIKEHELASQYLAETNKKFKQSEKAKLSKYMMILTKTQFEGNGEIKDYIMTITDAAERLNSLDVNISDKQLVFMILQALPSKLNELEVSYNSQDENWSVDKLISQCVQKEARQQSDRT